MLVQSVAFRGSNGSDATGTGGLVSVILCCWSEPKLSDCIVLPHARRFLFSAPPSVACVCYTLYDSRFAWKRLPPATVSYLPVRTSSHLSPSRQGCCGVKSCMYPPPRFRASCPVPAQLLSPSVPDLTRAGSHVTPWKKQWAKDVFFGMNVLHESLGVLRVGDEVDVLRVASKTSSKKTR